MQHGAADTNPLHGVMAEFDSVQELVAAARRAVAEGYRRAEAYTPFPVEELNDILHVKRTRLPKVILAGGILGMLSGFALQYFISVIDFPLNVGGRPLASWIAFIVPSYELTILFSAIAAAVGMLAFNGLPQPYHPVFNVPRFALASSDRFFLVIEAADPKFDHAGTARFLEDLGAKGVYDVAE
ncbi:MAG: DUF3341 domain-containing protein [Vicinamibacterales bacterium]